MKVNKQIQPLLRSATFQPSSFNEADNTIELVASTEAEVLQRNWDYGTIIEILSHQPAQIRLDRLNSGANVLDNHNSYGSLRNTVVGVVESARAEGGQLKVKIRLSSREDMIGFVQDVKDGILRNISIGYRVYKYDITEEEGKLPVFRAVDWEPFEVSFVSVPADYSAGTRSAQTPATHQAELNYVNSKRNHMTLEQMRAEAARLRGLTAPTDEERDELRSLESRLTEAERAASNPPVPAAPASAAPAAPAAPAAGDRTASSILKSVRAAGLSSEFAQELIDTEGITLERAIDKIHAKLAEGSNSAPTRSANAGVRVTADETDKRRSGMENAVLVRANAGGDPAKLGEFRGASLIDLARMSLEAQGVNTRGMTGREIALAALNADRSRGMHTTSDFPIILGNTINRSLRQAYSLATRTFTPFVRQTSARDFREMTRTQLGDLSSLDKVTEGGEYKTFTIGEGAEKYKVAKYGKVITISWETLVNDDLDAFGRLPQILANAAAQTQSDIVYGILTGNPNMSDTVALFHADHGNLAGSGGAINATTMAAARAAMRKQKSPGGQFLNIAPKFLIVGPDKELEALQITSANYVAAKQSDVNVFQGLTTPIVEGRLTGNQWYLSADPSQIDTIETAFLDGEELFIETKDGFEVDGMQAKVRMVFGAKAIDHRGVYKNAGN